MADKTYKTKKPTGLAFARKGNTVTLSWKCGDTDYNKAQQIFWNYYGWQFKYDKKKKKNVGTDVKTATSNTWKSLGTKVRSYNLSYNPKDYFPYKNKTLATISVSVRGQRANFKKNKDSYTTQMSDYTNLQYKPERPNAPSIKANLSGEYDNVTTFSWESSDHGGNTVRIFVDYEREMILLKDSNITTGSKVNWSKAKTMTGTEKSHTVKEDSAKFNGNYSYTRWYRVRSRGPKGVSDWKYAKHVYAMPAYSKDVKTKVDQSSRARGYYMINVKWASYATAAHPVDRTTIEYLDTIPASTLSNKTNKDGSTYKHAELIAPVFSGGTEGAAIKDTAGKDGVVLSVPTRSELDHALVVRVNNHHDRNVAYGATTYVKGSFAKLTTPTITSVGSLDPDTKKLTITATNNSEVPNTHLAVLYKSSQKPGKEYCIGIIPPGQDTITLTLPDSCLTHNYTLGVKARLGDYSPNSHNQNTLTIYKLTNKLMESSKTWGDGTIPQPPKNITLTSPKTGTIRVNWTSTWSSATGAELSWSQDEDAWESTNEPSTYVVNSTNATVWNITGLDIGTWYVRIRLFKEDADSISYSAYSELEEIKLASAPAIPSLTLSDSVIPEDGAVTCYWVYTTTDGTNQNYAEICTATLNNDGTYTYGRAIAHTNTAQFLTIYAEDQKWKSGKKYYLAVRVTSASGETSEDWSTPVPITIANKINIAIDETSMIKTVEVVEQEYSLTDDQTVETGKDYYTRSGSGTDEDPYVYTVVASPEENPAEAGYYEMNPILETIYALTEMPLSVTLGSIDNPYSLTDDTSVDAGKIYYTRSGSGTPQNPYIYTEVVNPSSNPKAAGYYEKTKVEGDITLMIERAESYHMDRPDENDFDGFEGETISVVNKEGSGTVSFEREDLIGVLDDGAKYNLIVSLTDSYGQTFTTDPLEFIVRWAHQAIIPEADVEVFTDGLYTTITPLTPTGYELTPDTSIVSGKTYFIRSGEGTDEDPYVYTEVDSPSGNPHDNGYYQSYDSSKDTCDVYRLSTDAPELILKDIKFGTKYVDPYPTLKTFGGYRVVYRTIDGDYITDENNVAWTDYLDSEDNQIDMFATIIDFSKDRVILPYDLELSNKWSKDFTETKYLGGSVQGDWNPAVSRTGTVKTNTIVFEDPDTIKAMRRLADYAGICHIRTPDGSNFTANVDVSEDRENKMIGKLARFTLDVTRVDNENLDGELYESWIKDNE